jgi:hypothetical protein
MSYFAPSKIVFCKHNRQGKVLFEKKTEYVGTLPSSLQLDRVMERTKGSISISLLIFVKYLQISGSRTNQEGYRWSFCFDTQDWKTSN